MSPYRVRRTAYLELLDGRFWLKDFLCFSWCEIRRPTRPLLGEEIDG